MCTVHVNVTFMIIVSLFSFYISLCDSVKPTPSMLYTYSRYDQI